MCILKILLLFIFNLLVDKPHVYRYNRYDIRLLAILTLLRVYNDFTYSRIGNILVSRLRVKQLTVKHGYYTYWI